MNSLFNKKKIARISKCLCIVLRFLYIDAKEDYIDSSHIFRNNKTYILTWNSLVYQNINPFYDYFYKYNKLCKENKPNYIVPKSYEIIRTFLNFSFIKIKWRSNLYGFFYKINVLENFYSCFNLRQWLMGKLKYEHEFIGIAAFYVGINVSYNNNGMMAKNKVNVGGIFGLGLMWSRFFWLLLYNYKNTSADKIFNCSPGAYFSHKCKNGEEEEKKNIWLFGNNVNEILNLSNVLKNWENWVNFDIVFDIIPLSIQFKKMFYINIEYKLGLVDIIVSTIKHKKRVSENKKSSILGHLLYNISINIGIY